MSRLFAPFRDPIRRVRAWINVGIAVVLFLALYVGANLVTSTPWFCNEVCHVVHADNARAWAEGPHRNIGCIQCHYPVNMDPISFTLDRADKLLDVWPTIAGTFEKPVNHYSRLGLVTTEEQCTQCHIVEQPLEPTPGILIDHEVHSEAGIPCTYCHNRVSHPEDFELTLEWNVKKEDFTTMTACFRCHSLGETAPNGQPAAPGACSSCHPADFMLRPASHDRSWAGVRGAESTHGEAAAEVTSETAEALHEWDEERDAIFGRGPRLFARLAGIEESIPVDVPPVATIDECSTCHTVAYCDRCHGVEMPHAEGIAVAHYDAFEESDARSCALCHNTTGSTAYDDRTCFVCHHPAWRPAKGVWLQQHEEAVESGGENECYACHREAFCASCHLRGEPSTPY